MNFSDWVVIAIFFIVLVGVAGWAAKRVRKSSDFYMAGGKLPWWISGVSHHVSGYSGVVFTGYMAVAYALGFNLYIWWAVNITIACVIGAFTIMPKWAKLRNYLSVESPTEYLKLRYNGGVQQLVCWAGIVLKLLDVAGKYTAIGILLNGFTGLPFMTGVIIAGVVTLFYVTVGGLWADAVNDFFQFIVQVIAGLFMFFIIYKNLNAMGTNYFTMWDKLPEGNSLLFREPYTFGFFIVFIFVVFLSYNGGTWNLATRFIATPNAKEAKKSGLLSGALYLIWPLIMFAPMWASPLLFSDIPAAEQKNIYSLMTTTYLPHGLIGIVLASMFAATLSMVASDSNAISSVISRDIIPVLSSKYRQKYQGTTPLKFARLVTFIFTLLTIIISLNNQYFGGVIGLIIKWFGALLGPTAIPMVLGLLPAFKHSGPKAAYASISIGLLAFILTKYAPGFFGGEVSLALSVGLPVLSSLIVYIAFSIFKIEKPSDKVNELMVHLK